MKARPTIINSISTPCPVGSLWPLTTTYVFVLALWIYRRASFVAYCRLY